MLSIIVPTFNEMNNGYIKRIIHLLSLSKHEVIFIDSNSTDGTAELIKQHSNITLIQTEETSRAARLNLGIQSATKEMILLHHPRSILSPEGINYLDHNQNNFNWGAFTHKFDKNHYLLKFTSWWSNNVRGDISQIYYLDHCLFAQSKLLKKVGTIPKVDIFEDTLLSQKLRNLFSPTRLPFLSTTSSIRFLSNGIWKQAIKNQILKIKYFTNFDHMKMNKDYETGLDLNTKYN